MNEIKRRCEISGKLMKDMAVPVIRASVSKPHIIQVCCKLSLSLYIYIYTYISIFIYLVRRATNHLQFLFQFCVGLVHVLQDTLRTCQYVKSSVYFSYQC